MRRLLVDHSKNVFGWRTKRKLVAFAVDDYGNVRLNSRQAAEAIQKNYHVTEQRFDQYDTLETKQDLEQLFEVLHAVKDRNERSAVFTPYALTQNLDFEKMKLEDFQNIHLEKLPISFSKLSQDQPKAYEGVWQLWKEGIHHGLMAPQFHGREHFNHKVISELLKANNQQLLHSLKNKSLSNVDSSFFSTEGWTATYSFWDLNESISGFAENIQSGIKVFEEVYGYKPTVFTPPAQQFPEKLVLKLSEWGLQGIERSFYQNVHHGYGKYKKRFSFTGYKGTQELVHLVRNVVFEPTNGKSDHVGSALKQIEAAFIWNKPAIISSHRVNFCGHIDPKNRKTGLDSLNVLLQAIVKKWPEVEFISSAELVKYIKAES